MPLTDTSPMPFGKYGPKPKGEGRLMQDVPMSYLHYLWADCKFKGICDTERHASETHKQNSWDVAMYIKESLPALKMEDEDRVW